jgi:tetratricopeptide (TPR) repeat protein
MRSGLWILIAVLVAGAAVGYLLRGRTGMDPDARDRAELSRIQDLGTAEAKIGALRDFIDAHPDSKLKSRAYYMISGEMISSLADTSMFFDFARNTIKTEPDAESKATMYYRMYGLLIDTDPDAAASLGRELLAKPIDAGWIYNYIGYDLAERGLELELALELCERALALAATAQDSASYLDSRGWVYYRKGMFAEAIADLESAVSISSAPDEEIMKHLAYAALMGGQAEKAFDTFRSILVMGEYDYARDVLDSLMTVKGYSPGDRKAFDQSIWEQRMASANRAADFELRGIDGDTYSFDASTGEVSIINFMSPT